MGAGQDQKKSLEELRNLISTVLLALIMALGDHGLMFLRVEWKPLGSWRSRLTNCVISLLLGLIEKTK